MNLFEKLNRLDDSLVESKRVVKKKKLTEDFAEQYTLEYAGKYGDTIARDYFDNYKDAEKFALELLDTYEHDNSNVYALIITDQDDNELFNRDVNIDDYDDDIDEMLTESMPKQRPARSLGYSYGIADIKDYAKKLLANTNTHEQKKMVEELVGGARVTCAQVDDLVARLTTYSQSLHKYINSSRTTTDVEMLLDEIKDLSI